MKKLIVLLGMAFLTLPLFAQDIEVPVPQQPQYDCIVADNPRAIIDEYITNNDKVALLCKAAMLHGEANPGLSMGIICGVDVINKINQIGTNQKDYKLISNVVDSPLDGLIFVTGFTPGNDQLVMHPNDLYQFTIIDKNGDGWQYESTAQNKAFINAALTDELNVAEQAIHLLDFDCNQVFEVTPISGNTGYLKYWK